MDRQTVRQRTRSNGRHRSGTSNPNQTRSGRSATASQARSHSQARAQTRHSSVPKSASPHKRSSYPLLLFVFGLWTVSLAMAALAARSLLDPTVSSSELVRPPAVSSAPAVSVEPPEVEAPPEAVLPSVSPSPVSEPLRSNPPSSLPDRAVAFDQTDLPGAALDDRDFYQPPRTNFLPILALGTMTISVAMSWVLVLRLLRPRRSPPMLQRSAGKPSTAKSAAKQLPAAPPQSAIVHPKTSVQEKPETTAQKTTAQTAKDAVETAMPAIVTVLSSEQGLPLDWEEPSLADSLDLRHHQSFSS